MSKKKKKKRKKAKTAETGGGSRETLISKNRRAYRDYDLGDRYEAGLVLKGTEVKSCRTGKAHVNDAYVQLRQGEAFLIGSHIAEYSHGGHFNHEPDRIRKLLLHKSELFKLNVRIRERGFVAVPLRLYFRHGVVKVEIAIAKGRTHEDRRDKVKEREIRREMERAMRRGRR